MLSYRHAYHAGNHADVLKHALLVAVLDHLNQKPKPWWYADSHAGAGLYDLSGAHATRKAEFAEGIGRLWHATDLPPLLARYVALVRESNPAGSLHLYPGSPWIAQSCARPDDRLRLFDLHPTDLRHLQDLFASHGRQVRVQALDGYAGLRSVLPPPPRRAAVLIDPSYELKPDYQRTADAMADSLQRFAQGTYLVWYPMLPSGEWRGLVEDLRALRASSWLDVRLLVRPASREGFGMYGSGLFVVNPPWTLPDQLGPALPWLAQTLGENGAGSWHLEHHIP